jgi:hypothetical protein
MQNTPFYMQEAPCESHLPGARLGIQLNLWIIFAFNSPVLRAMFPGPKSPKRVVVQCRACDENIPAPVGRCPSQPIADRYLLCHEHRRHLPSEVFLGQLSHLMIRKPVTTADGRPGEMTTPRFKGKPNLDLSLPCPLCGYKIQLASGCAGNHTSSSARSAASPSTRQAAGNSQHLLSAAPEMARSVGTANRLYCSNLELNKGPSLTTDGRKIGQSSGDK